MFFLRLCVSAVNQIALTPIATCRQFVPSLTGKARHRTRAPGRQINDAARKLRRRDTSGDRRRVVGEGWNLDLFTRTNPLKTARYKFAHKFDFGLLVPVSRWRVVSAPARLTA